MKSEAGREIQRLTDCGSVVRERERERERERSISPRAPEVLCTGNRFGRSGREQVIKIKYFSHWMSSVSLFLLVGVVFLISVARANVGSPVFYDFST